MYPKIFWYHLEFRNPVTKAFVLTARNQASASSLEALRIRGFEVLPEKIKSLHAVHCLALLKMLKCLLSRQLISYLVIIFPVFVFGFSYFIFQDNCSCSSWMCCHDTEKQGIGRATYFCLCPLRLLLIFPFLLLVSLFSKCGQGDLVQLGCMRKPIQFQC